MTLNIPDRLRAAKAAVPMDTRYSNIAMIELPAAEVVGLCEIAMMTADIALPERGNELTGEEFDKLTNRLDALLRQAGLGEG